MMKNPFLSMSSLTLSRYFHPSSFSSLISSFPPSLTELTFESGFYLLHNNIVFPSTITKIDFGAIRARPEPPLPPSLIHLSFGESFNGSIGDLPLSVTHLTFGHSFNPSLPPLLTHLTLGNLFNAPIHFLPPSITHLIIGDNFSHDISLPSNLQLLHYGKRCKFKINHFPPTLTQLSFKRYYMSYLPELPSLTYLDFGGSDYYDPTITVPVKSLSLLSLNALLFYIFLTILAK